MTTEKHDPWALLREAQDFVGFLPTRTDAIEKALSIQRRIDAALAERQDSAQDAVEWTADAFGNNYVKQGNVLLQVAETIDGRWAWGMRVEGYAPTEAEARRAATAAARGMK